MTLVNIAPASQFHLYEGHQSAEGGPEVPGPREGREGRDGGGHHADQDVGQRHVADVHVGHRAQARAPDTRR